MGGAWSHWGLIEDRNRERSTLQPGCENENGELILVLDVRDTRLQSLNSSWTVAFDFAHRIRYDGTRNGEFIPEKDECRMQNAKFRVQRVTYGFGLRPTRKGDRLARHLIWMLLLGVGSSVSGQELAAEARSAMSKATRFFRSEVATEGGYLGQYSEDMSMRQGERVATETMIWIQPPGTPTVGMTYLDAFAATQDTMYLNGAIDVARALVWGQLSTGGWDYDVDFDPEGSKRWHYRRDVYAGDTDAGERRHRSVFDDDTSQSAMRLLMRVDSVLDFKDAEIHNAVTFGLDAFLRVQYPNGAWPQRWQKFPNPDDYPVLKARYPESWPWVWPDVDYRDFYTFNDNAIADVIEVMLEAYRTYDDQRYLDAALSAGGFVILAQMPEPQPTWAQQYNHQMEPVWARRFEVASVTGGESFGVMRSLLDLYVHTGEKRFLDPIPRALAWAKRSVLPNGQMARFYELKTNTPLYFVRDTYELTYSDADMPTHYAFKTTGQSRIESIDAYFERVRTEDRDELKQQSLERWSGPITDADRAQVKQVIAQLDAKGRWVEDGAMRSGVRGTPRIPARVISSRTFNRNLGLLARFIGSTP